MERQYIIRLDDACPYGNLANWDRMEAILDVYGIKPLVGAIPNCRDENLISYGVDANYPGRIGRWKDKGWTFALHGYDHVFLTEDGGLNPVNHRSEFAGVELSLQRDKIRRGVAAFRDLGIQPVAFFAPAHTFDANTLRALKECSDIRVISDTVAFDRYNQDGLTFVPQQSGSVRNLPFRTVTFCYHPNIMTDADFEKLNTFLDIHKSRFAPFPVGDCNRRHSAFDSLLSRLYFARR